MCPFSQLLGREVGWLSTIEEDHIPWWTVIYRVCCADSSWEFWRLGFEPHFLEQTPKMYVFWEYSRDPHVISGTQSAPGVLWSRLLPWYPEGSLSSPLRQMNQEINIWFFCFPVKIRGSFGLWVIWNRWQWTTGEKTVLTHCTQVSSKPKLNSHGTNGWEAPAITAWLRPLVALQREDRGSIKNEAAICGNEASPGDAPGFNSWLHNLTEKPFKHAEPRFSL